MIVVAGSGALISRGKRAVRASLRNATLAVAGPPRPLAQIEPGPLIVSGFLNEVLGIGRAARLTLSALESAGYAPIAHDLRGTLTQHRFWTAPFPTSKRGGCWLLHCNAPEAIEAFLRFTPHAWRARYRIGYWAWELPQAPSDWISWSKYFHEVWTPSAFVASALSGAHAQVRIMPHPIANVGDKTPLQCDGISDDAFLVLSMADLRSSLARKNPLGAIAAFRQAFPVPSSKVRMVVKVVARHFSPVACGVLSDAIADRRDISLLYEELTDAATLSLIRRADVLLSLHRAEGFGLSLAEALSAGTPVVATGWSGNMQFMQHMKEFLVRYRLVTVADSSSVYPQTDQKWAEPDIAHAAKILRRLYEQPVSRSVFAKTATAALLENQKCWSRESLRESPIELLTSSTRHERKKACHTANLSLHPRSR